MSLRLEEPMKQRRRDIPEDDPEARASLEDRQVIKAVLAGAATLLFLLVVAGWL